MSSVIEGATLEASNVLTYRGRLTKPQMADIVREMDKIIADSGAEKTVKAITATYGLDNQAGSMVMDIEIMMPLSKTIDVPTPYRIKPLFRLKNAVMIRHEGSISSVQESANKLMVYIKEKELIPITVGYNVTIQEPELKNGIEGYIVDLYVGVSDNIL